MDLSSFGLLRSAAASFASGLLLLSIAVGALAQSETQTPSAPASTQSASGEASATGPDHTLSLSSPAAEPASTSQSGAGLGADSKAVPTPSFSTGNFGPDPAPAGKVTEDYGNGDHRGPRGFGDRARNRPGGGFGGHSHNSFSPDDDQFPASGASSFRGSSQGDALDLTGSAPDSSFGMQAGHVGAGMDSHGGMPGGGMGQGGSLNLDSLFRIADAYTQAASRSLGPSSALGNTLSRAAHIAQGGGTGVNIPFASSAGRFNFGYHESFGREANAMGGEVGQGSAQASFNSRGFKNDLLHFSASASYGGMGGGFGGGGGGAGISSFSEAGGAGIGSGHSESGSSPFSGMSSGMGGGSMGGRGGFAPPSASGMNGGGMNGMGAGRGRQGASTTPAVSLKLSF